MSSVGPAQAGWGFQGSAARELSSHSPYRTATKHERWKDMGLQPGSIEVAQLGQCAFAGNEAAWDCKDWLKP